VPGIKVDKHSTGGVGDKTSLILGPMLAACGIPVAMLTGRALGHTGGTADKLEAIPGLVLAFDRERCVALLREHRLAIGIATADVAPADRRLYALRNRTATVSSVPLVVGSILSKKLATGAEGIVFDVKCGSGAIFPDPAVARSLATKLVETTRALGRRAAGVLSDMSQPLGSWVGHASEVNESLAVLRGEGEARLTELCLELSVLAAGLSGHEVSRQDLERTLTSGLAYELFVRWACGQGASAAWSTAPELELAPRVHPITAIQGGVLARVECEELGLLVQELANRGGTLDHGVALRVAVRCGESVEPGQELATLYLRGDDPAAVATATRCFEVAAAGAPPQLIHEYF
jgi:pyrimidine-nucleoside phosphorylase